MPTFFITLSAAETHWPELLKMLKKTLDGEDNANVDDLSFSEKCRLIKGDPVTCARYFNHRLKLIIKALDKSGGGPFGSFKVEEYYYRIEFQHRGSPHAHMLFWIKIQKCSEI